MKISPTLRRLAVLSAHSSHLQNITIWVVSSKGNWVVRNGVLLPIPLGRRT